MKKTLFSLDFGAVAVGQAGQGRWQRELRRHRMVQAGQAPPVNNSAQRPPQGAAPPLF